jgi:SpoVK/Ycf46/Vps4 family AAA+-type ATPase
VAAMCNGYVGADLQALCREAAMSAVKRALKGPNPDQINLVGMEEWDEARKNVGPSIVRGAAAEVPRVSWEDIGGLHEVKVCHNVFIFGLDCSGTLCNCEFPLNLVSYCSSMALI